MYSRLFRVFFVIVVYFKYCFRKNVDGIEMYQLNFVEPYVYTYTCEYFVGH